MNQNLDIVKEARSYIGVRWVHQGRSREGVDCVGLPSLVLASCRGMSFQFPDYAKTNVDNKMIELAGAYFPEVEIKDIQPGDMVVMGFEKNRHMGIIGDYPYEGLSFIHAYLPNRKVVEQRLDSVWVNLIMAAFRIP